MLSEMVYCAVFSEWSFLVNKSHGSAMWCLGFGLYVFGSMRNVAMMCYVFVHTFSEPQRLSAHNHYRICNSFFAGFGWRVLQPGRLFKCASGGFFGLISFLLGWGLLHKTFFCSSAFCSAPASSPSPCPLLCQVPSVHFALVTETLNPNRP